MSVPLGLIARHQTAEVTIQHDDGTGDRGTRGTRTPNWVTLTGGRAIFRYKTGTDPLGLGSQVEPEQLVEAKFFRPEFPSEIKPGMRLVYGKETFEIISVAPVIDAYTTGEVNITAVDRRTAR